MRNGIFGGIFLSIMELMIVLQTQWSKSSELHEQKMAANQEINQYETMYKIKVTNSKDLFIYVF